MPATTTVVEKIPTKSSRKSEMQTWPKNHGIPYSDTDLKMAKITAVQPSAVYLTDECVRLPVAHCELSPIELAWANVKEYVRKHNQQFTMAEVERLTPTGISVTTPDLWKKYTEHCRRVEDKYWEQDGLIEETVEEFTIEFGVDSDDSDEESGMSEYECDNIAPTQPLQSPTTPTHQITPESRRLIRNLQADTGFMNDVAPLP